MNHFQEEMEKAREAAESALSAHEAEAQNTQETTHQLEQDLKPILHSIAQEFVAGDSKLDLQLATDGFTIVYESTPVVPKFVVSSTCNDSEVTLNVTDGKWEDLPNVIGNWAGWTDQKPVYVGPLNEHRIRRSLERAFLPWYQAVVGERLQ